MLAIRVLGAPMSLIGTAVSQVHLSRAPEEMRGKTLDRFTGQVIAGLFRSGVGPIIFVGIIAPSLFPYIFGKEWARAGEIVSWMTPWFVMQFLATPVSMTLHVTQNQRIALVIQLAGLLLRVGVVLCVSFLDSTHTVEAYSLTGFVFYAGYLIAIVRVAGTDIGGLVRSSRVGLITVLLWIAAASVVCLGLWFVTRSVGN